MGTHEQAPTWEMLSTWDGRALGHVGAKEDGQSWEVWSQRAQTWVSVGLSRTVMPWWSPQTCSNS